MRSIAKMLKKVCLLFFINVFLYITRIIFFIYSETMRKKNWNHMLIARVGRRGTPGI